MRPGPRPRLSLCLACAAAASLSLASGRARADVSSWLSLGGGATSITEATGVASVWKPTVRIDLGVGSPATKPVVVGALVRTSSFVGAGTDLAAAARFATGGFARGGWGIAVDGGAYTRGWGVGADGVLGSLALGGPWGLQASFDVTRGGDGARTWGAILGIDLLRLTAWRTTGLGWFPNPMPAVEPPR